MNVSLPPPETIHVHFPHFLLSAFVVWKVAGFVSKTYALRPQELWFSSARPMVFVPKTYGFGAQERLPSGPKPMVLGTKSAFRRGQERVGEGLPCRLL